MTPWKTLGADLHLHTTCSDGAYTPEALAAAARKANLKTIAVTDHDSVEGIAAAQRAAEGSGVEVLPGIELGVALGDDARDEIHIVGLFLDPGNPELCAAAERIRSGRLARALKMIEKLNHIGVQLRSEEVLAAAGGGSVGRLHIAQALLRRKRIGTVGEAFQRWLGQGGPAYVARERPSAGEAVRLIHGAGGVAVMAHPAKTGRDADIPALIAAGIDGIEVYGGDQARDKEPHYLKLAAAHGLLVGGGSDCHGTNKDRTLIGQVRLEEERVEALRRRAREWKEKR
jgi:predicted metal-dependent phosphoesterase TrpH